jgi:hypothetical protein
MAKKDSPADIIIDIIRIILAIAILIIFIKAILPLL